MFKSCWKGEQVDLFTFPPVCLPSNGQILTGSDGVVAGNFSWSIFFSPTIWFDFWISHRMGTRGCDSTLPFRCSSRGRGGVFLKRSKPDLSFLGSDRSKGGVQGENWGEWIQLHWGSPLCWWQQKRRMSGKRTDNWSKMVKKRSENG